jgi:putative membrane protein
MVEICWKFFLMDPKDPHITAHLANEQTFLSWLRTGIETTAFGFLAIKFGFFESRLMGIILVATGGVMIIMAYFRYRATAKQLAAGNFSPRTNMVTVTAVTISIIMVVLFYYLYELYFN